LYAASLASNATAQDGNRSYRAILIDHQPPPFASLWKLWLLSIVVFVAGHAWFYKLRKSFADLM